MWICYKCGENIEGQLDVCGKCGTYKDSFLSHIESKERNKQSLINDGLIPWQRRKQIGLFNALWQTMRLILFKPGKFFDILVNQDETSDAFRFYLTFNIIFIIFAIIIAIPLFVLKGNFAYLLYFIVVPIAVIVGIYVSSAIMHLFVLLFRGEGGFKGTFNIFAYITPAAGLLSILLAICLMLMGIFLAFFYFSPSIFVIFFIGALGYLVEVVWIGIVIIIGYRKIHNLNISKAIFAFLVPAILIGALRFGFDRFKDKTLNNLRQARIIAYESKARVRILMISSACQSYYQINQRYPISLQDLVDVKPPYIDSNLAKAVNVFSAIDGYFFVYVSSGDNHFNLYASPVDSKSTGQKIYFIDQTGVLRLNGPDGISIKEIEAKEESEKKQ